MNSSWSTKLGLFTGPLMIVLGLIAKQKNDSGAIPMVLIIFGAVRFVLSAWLYFKQKKQ